MSSSISPQQLQALGRTPLLQISANPTIGGEPSPVPLVSRSPSATLQSPRAAPESKEDVPPLCSSPLFVRSGLGKKSNLVVGEQLSRTSNQALQGDGRSSVWLEAGFNHACAQDEGLLSSVADLSQAGTPGVADSMADFSWQDRFRRPLRDCASVMIGSVTWDDLDCDSSDDNVQDPNPRPFAATEPEISHLVCVPEEPHSCMTPSSSAGAGCGSPSGSDKKQSVHPSNQFDFDSLAGEADIVCQDICQHEAPDGQTADPPSANDRVRDSMQIHFCSMVGDPEATLGFDLRADSQAETSAELAIMEAYNFCIDQSHGSEEKVGENEQLKSAASPRPEDLSRESEASFLCDATLQDTCVEMNYDDDDSFAAEFGDDTAAAAEAAMSELFGAFSLNSPLPFANKASCSPSATTDVGAPEAPCLSEHASQDIPAHELLPVQPSKPEDIEGEHTPKPDGLQSDSSAAGERILSVLAPPLLEEESETVIRRMADEKSSEDDCNEGEGTAEIAGDEGCLDAEAQDPTSHPLVAYLSSSSLESLEPSLQDANDLPGREALAAPEPQRPASHEFLTQADDFRDASDQHLWISVAHTNVVFGDDIRNSVQVTTMDRALQNRTEERPPVKANLQSVYEWEADARESRDGFFSTSPGMERADDGDGPGPLNDGAFFPFAPEGEASAVAEAKDSSSEEEFGQDDMAEMLECLAMATPPPEDRSRGETPETEIVEFLESLLPLDDLEQAAQAGDELMLDHLDHDNKAAGALGSGCQDSGRAPPSTPGTKQRNDTEHPDVCHTSPAMQGADLSGDIDEPSAGGSCFQVTHVFDDTVADLGKESPGGAMNEVDSISATMSADAPSPSSTLAADPMQPATPACSLGQPSDQNPECSADASKENLGLQGTEIQGPEDPQSQGCKTSVSPLPPSWMLAALSWQNMDASMVLTGISMALPGITSNLDCGDALDLELQSPGKFNAKPPMTIENEVPETDEDLTAVDESIFEESSSLAHSLELESSRQPLDAKVRLFGDVAMPSKETQPATEKSADFVIGRSSPTRNSCNSSRLRAPKSAFDFFNQSTASHKEGNPFVSSYDAKSIEELFSVATPARFKAGVSHRAQVPNIHVSCELQPSARKKRDKSFFPGGLSCPGPVFGSIADDANVPASPTSWLFPVHPLSQRDREGSPLKPSQGGAAAEMLSDAEDDEHKSDAPFRADSSPDLPGNLYTQTTPTDGSIGGATANASQAPDSLAAVAEAFKGNKIMHSSDASKTSSSFSVDDTPLKSHRASGGDRVSRRARPVRDSLTSQDETTQDPGNVSSSRESSQPVSRQSRSASVRASQETMQDALKATQHAASSGGGVLFIGGDKPVKPTPVAVDDAGSKPVAGNNLQNIFSRGVSRLRKPGSFGRAGTRAPEVIAPSPSAADKQDDGAAAKKTFGWGRPAAQPSHLPSGPGKRRKKYGADENEAAAAAAAASTNMFQHSAHHSMAKMAGHTLKKITTPLNGFKKSASKFLASHSAKKPSIQLRGNDLSTAFDAYASESPTDAGL